MIPIATREEAHDSIIQLNIAGFTQEFRETSQFPKAEDVILFIVRKDHPHALDQHFLDHNIRGVVIDQAGYMETFPRAHEAGKRYEKITENEPATEGQDTPQSPETSDDE